LGSCTAQRSCSSCAVRMVRVLWQHILTFGILLHVCWANDSERASTSLPTPGEIEKLVCEVATQKMVEDKASASICSEISKKVKIPDCQALVEGLWDKITAKCPKGGRVRIDPVSGHFVGKDGRTLLFHGVNVVQKSFPWHPSLGDFDPRSSLNAGDMATLKSWGFNAVRLGVMWPGVEPIMGQYNATYLQVMKQLVDDLYSHGIYTIVDFHQDSMSEQWCGEGVPSWMVPMLGPLMTSCQGTKVSEVAKFIGQCKTFAAFNISIDKATGFPNTKECLAVTFDAYSRTPELVSAWGNFYKSQALQKKFQDYWSKVASVFADSMGVIGYDLINEPLNGNFFDDITRIEPGVLDRDVLQPMYKALHDVIRVADPLAIIMYEPPPFPDTYPDNIPVLGGVYSMGSTSGPAGTDVAHQALSYHIYSCGFATSDCDRNGDTKPGPCPVCDSFASKAVSTREADRKRLGGGGFLTEFGACSGSPQCLAEIARVTSQADEALHSWAYWQFKYNHDITTVSGPIEGFYKDDGTLQDQKVASLSRTYAPAVAGKPYFMKFDDLTGAFRLRYSTENFTWGLPTEIFLNEEMHYSGNANGYVVSASNAATNANAINQVLATATSPGDVDIVITRPYAGATSGEIHTPDKDYLTWSLSSEDKPGFELSTSQNITWWKAIYVYADDGKLICSLTTQDGNHGPARCDFDQMHDCLFDYRIEIWKAKFAGVHTHVDTIPSSTYGPLLNKRIRFSWLVDGAAQEEVIV